MGALGLLAETLVSEPDVEVAQRLASRIHTEAFRVSRIIDDLLDLSRIESEEAPPREPMLVNLVMAEAIERVRATADQRGITISLSEPHPPVAVLGDRRQLVSAMHALLENAVTYSYDRSTVVVSGTVVADRADPGGEPAGAGAAGSPAAATATTSGGLPSLGLTGTTVLSADPATDPGPGSPGGLFSPGDDPAPAPVVATGEGQVGGRRELDGGDLGVGDATGAAGQSPPAPGTPSPGTPAPGTPSPGARETVRLAVADHGVGIPARDLDRIFERFYRVDHGRSRDTGGTGLGLSIVRHVANNHQGWVDVESREGEGSTFTLVLPLQPERG
jgi:signal transduction histidine kinase